MNDLIKPVKFYPKNTCPVCGKGELILHQVEDSRIELDEEAKPRSYKSTISSVFVCDECLSSFSLGKDIMKLEDGSYKYVTEAEKIYEKDRMSKLPEQTHLHADKNPFMKIFAGFFD